MVVATGFFDGVHLGHRLAIDRLVQVARERGDQSMVVTFWPHPRNVLQKDASSLRLLTTMAEKKRLLTQAGVDRIEVVEFTREFGALTTEEYLREYVIGRFGAKAIVLGYDNRFGSDGADTQTVADVARRLGLEVYMGDRLAVGSAKTGPDSRIGDGSAEGRTVQAEAPAISSTRIRAALAAGDVVSANAMLGYEYPLYGVVVEGNRLGRKIGFPTANMQLYEPLKMVPGNGAYLVKVRTLHREFYGMCNVGTRPTIGPGSARTIETNIFGFDEDIYGLDIGVSFLRKIRDEARFASLDELRQQLSRDKDLCESLIALAEIR